jgi:RNA polymerase sigma factor (sigma-70 family)
VSSNYDSEASKTRLTLLGRLRLIPLDPVAWSEFVEWYGKKIYVWCRNWGLQEADAQDVTQEVFLKLSSRMHDFCYDPKGSFRAWLKTVSHHTWQDYIAKQRRPGQGSGGDGARAWLSAVEARDDLEKWIAAAGDEELFKEAAVRVQLRVEPRTWDAFRLLALEGRSGAEAAKILGMKVGALFVARSKIQRMLREELARLDPQ